MLKYYFFQKMYNIRYLYISKSKSYFEPIVEPRLTFQLTLWPLYRYVHLTCTNEPSVKPHLT